MADNKRMLKMDMFLCDFLKNREEKMSFEEVFSQAFAKMSPMHSIVRKYSDNKEREEPIVRKGKLKPVEFKIESRGGNKKVTSIRNLDEFLIDAKELQHQIRTQISVSASVEYANAAAAPNSYTISVQGNQIAHISEILRSEWTRVNTHTQFKLKLLFLIVL